MSRIAVTIEIDAAPAEVWAAVEPIERHVDWMTDAVRIRFATDQTRGVGTAFQCDTKVGPITLVDRMQITEWEPERAMGVLQTGVVAGSGRFTLTPIDFGRRTRFAWTEELTFPGWLGGRLGELVGGKLVMKTIWRRNLRGLKALIESPDVSAGSG